MEESVHLRSLPEHEAVVVEEEHDEPSPLSNEARAEARKVEELALVMNDWTRRHVAVGQGVRGV